MSEQWLNRRAFLSGLGCAGLTAGLPKLSAAERLFGVCRVREYSGSGIALPAIASACMPETLVITPADGDLVMHGSADLEETLSHGYVEFRKYSLDRPERMYKTLLRHGIRPLLTGAEGAFLFSFATLASREKAWRELSAASDWMDLRPQLTDLAIFHHRP